MDVDDDDEYMNAAAARAAFVVTVSVTLVLIFISSTQFPKNIGLNHGGLISADFLHSGTPLLRRN